MRRTQTFMLCFSMLLCSSTALATVDISTLDKVEVGSWGDLKDALSDSNNVGKAIVLTGNITADVNNPIDTVVGSGMVIDGKGFTITGKEGTSDGQFINFDIYDKTDLVIQNVKLEKFGDVEIGTASGGAIKNGGYKIGAISGDFSNNYVKSTGETQYDRGYGGAIYNDDGAIGDIRGNFSGNYANGKNRASGGAIYNSYQDVSIIENINGNFSGNYANGKNGASGGAISNGDKGTIKYIGGIFSTNAALSETGSANGGAIYNTGTIEGINGDFIHNYTQSEVRAATGGAINNWDSSAKIGDISGDFTNNYAQSTDNYAQGGAIYNWGTIGDISGYFNDNFAKSTNSYAVGGAIYNFGNTLTLVNSSFEGNYVETGASRDSAMGQKTLGGAIYSEADLTIKADKGDSIFSGNKVKWADGEDSSAIAMVGSGTPTNLSLDSRNGGLIQFDDKIISWGEIDDLLLQARNSGAAVSDDGVGGYIVDDGSEQIHVKKTDEGFLYPYDVQTDKNSSYLNDQLTYLQSQGYELQRDGENYLLINHDYGDYYEYTKQDNGYYTQFNGSLVPEYGSNITITGDESSQVVFNNELENIGTIDISGTNVAINQGVGTFSRSIVHDNGVLNVNNGATAADTIINNLGTMNVNTGGVSNRTAVNDAAVLNVEGGIADDNTLNSGAVMNVNSGVSNRTAVNDTAVLNVEGGTANDNTLNSGAVMNVNSGEANRTEVNENAILTVSGGMANDNTIHSQGRVEVNAGGTANRNNVEDGGVLHVATNGVAQNTTVNSGGQLITEDKATVNNLLANDGANLNIDAGSYLVGNIILHAGAIMEGTYDYSQIFKDDVSGAGSLTLVGGLNDILTENSLINTTAEKKLNLTAGEYAIGDGAQAVKGWDMLKVKDNATVKLEGNIELTGPNKKLIVENGSTLDLAGHSPSNYVISGSVNNDGLMSFTHSDDEADDVTTIEGNYKAYNNAKMSIDVDPINNVSDLLRIEGDVEGKTDVILNSTVYEGKPTALIKFVEAQNDDLTSGAAFDIYRVVNSAYEWNSLYKDGAWYTGTTDLISDDSESGYGDSNTGNMEDDEDLESDAELPEKPEEPDNPGGGDGDNKPNPSNPRVVGEAIAYMGLPSAGIEQTRSMMQAVSDKVSATKVYYSKCCGFYDYVYNYGGLSNAWVNPVYSYSKVKSPYNYEADISGLEGGFDIQSDTYNRLGVFASFRQGEYDFDGRGDEYMSKVGSSIDIDSYILGLYHRYDAGKAWVMSQVFAGYQDVDFSSDDGVSSNTDGVEFGGSVAMGLVFNPWRGITVEPIARVSYTQINYDNAKDRYGKTAKFSDVRNVEIEGGLRLEKNYNRRNGYAKIYFQPSIIQNIGSGDVTVTSLSKVHGLENSTLGRMSIGGSMSFDDKWSGFANTSYTFGSDYNNLMVNMGVNYAF